MFGNKSFVVIIRSKQNNLRLDKLGLAFLGQTLQTTFKTEVECTF